MASIERTAYPRLTGRMSEAGLRQSYSLTEDEKALVLQSANGSSGRLTFAVLLKTRQSLGAHVCMLQDNRVVSSTHLVEAGPDAGRAGALVELGRRDGKECHEEAHGAGCACDVLRSAEWRFAKGCNVFIMAAVPLSQAVEELSTTLYDSDTRAHRTADAPSAPTLRHWRRAPTRHAPRRQRRSSRGRADRKRRP